MGRKVDVSWETVVTVDSEDPGNKGISKALSKVRNNFSCCLNVDGFPESQISPIQVAI
jgi:hypothetical protein